MNQELLVQNGFDVNGAMKRFMNNEALYLKCLKKMLNDTNIKELRVAFDNGDCENAFKAAHSIKGFVSNLGIETLHQQIHPIVETLRGGSLPSAETLAQFETTYDNIYHLIESLE